MKFSYFCNHCGKHLRSGNHTACKKVLRTQRKDNEMARIAEGERTRQRYESGKLGEALAKIAEGE